MDKDSIQSETVILQQEQIKLVRDVNYKLLNIENNLIVGLDSASIQNQNLVAELRNLENNVSNIGNELIEIKSDIKDLKQEKILGKIGYDTVFTVTVTLFIFILGIAIDRWLKWRTQEKNRNKIIKYYCDNLNKFSSNLLTPLTNGYKNFYQDYNIDTGIPLTPPRVLTSEISRISEMEFKEIIESFDYNEEIYKARGHVDFIGGLLSEVDEYHKYVLEKTNSLRDLLQRKTETYIDILAQFLKDERLRNPKYSESELWNIINNKVVLFHTEIAKSNSLTDFRRKILRELQHFFVEKKLYETEAEIEKMVKIGHELSNRLYELKYITVEIRLEYQKYWKICDKIDKEIKMILEKFKKNNWL